MTQANQMTPMPIVSLSRFRSATEDPPRELGTPPPNMSDIPPPRPLWSSTSRIISALAAIRTMVKSVSSTTAILRHVSRCSEHRHVVETADRSELVGLEARATHESTVDVRLRHDRGDVGRLHGAAVQDPDRVGGVAVQLADLGPDAGADLLGVLRRRDLAGADRPDRLVREHQARHL